MKNNFLFEPDLAAKTIHIVREFDAPLENVWRAWTEPDLIEKWIAPRPWTAETKIMDFTVGGTWLYAMVSPEGQKHWSHAEFTAIEKGCSISSANMFSDEDGNPFDGASKSHTVTKFLSVDGKETKVDVMKTFTDEATVKMFAEMGFKEGTIMGYNQLDELLTSDISI
ncbi:MAG: SRPBCC domain-containing protein [Mucilaginibacter sp.]